MISPLAINGQNYRAGKLNALAQFHVLRRLAPVLASIGMSLEQIQKFKTPEDFARVLGPISETLSQMPDEEANYVIFTCLAVTSREQGDGRFAPVTSKNAIMFEDIDMAVMVRLVAEVLKENFLGFLKGLGGATESTSS